MAVQSTSGTSWSKEQTKISMEWAMDGEDKIIGYKLYPETSSVMGKERRGHGIMQQNQTIFVCARR